MMRIEKYKTILMCVSIALLLLINVDTFAAGATAAAASQEKEGATRPTLKRHDRYLEHFMHDPEKKASNKRRKHKWRKNEGGSKTALRGGAAEAQSQETISQSAGNASRASSRRRGQRTSLSDPPPTGIFGQFIEECFFVYYWCYPEEE